jgi:hypothetical protein
MLSSGARVTRARASPELTHHSKCYSGRLKRRDGRPFPANGGPRGDADLQASLQSFLLLHCPRTNYLILTLCAQVALLDKLLREGVGDALRGSPGEDGAGPHGGSARRADDHSVTRRMHHVAALDGRILVDDVPQLSEAVRKPVVVLGEGGKTVEVDPEGTMYDPNTLQPIRGFSLHPDRDAMTFAEDPARYLAALRQSIHFHQDADAKSTCGLIVTGSFITFVIPTGPSDIIESDGSVLQPKDEIVAVNSIPVTAETVGVALKGTDVPGTRAAIRVRKATWFGEEIFEEVEVERVRLPGECVSATNFQPQQREAIAAEMPPNQSACEDGGTEASCGGGNTHGHEGVEIEKVVYLHERAAGGGWKTSHLGGSAMGFVHVHRDGEGNSGDVALPGPLTPSSDRGRGDRGAHGESKEAADGGGAHLLAVAGTVGISQGHDVESDGFPRERRPSAADQTQMSLAPMPGNMSAPGGSAGAAATSILVC